MKRSALLATVATLVAISLPFNPMFCNRALSDDVNAQDRSELLLKKLHSIRAHQGSVISAQFSPFENVLATCSVDRTVKIWGLGDQAPRKIISELPPAKNNGTWKHEVVFSPNGKTVLVACAGDSVRLFDVSTGRQLAKKDVGARSAAFSPDGKWVVTADGEDADVQVWQVEPFRKEKSLKVIDVDIPEKSLSLGTVAYAPDGKTFAAVVGGASQGVKIPSQLSLWHAEDRTQIFQFEVPERIHAMAYSQDSKQLVIGGTSGRVLVYSTSRQGQQIPDPKVVKKLIVDLDDNQFATRERAQLKLMKMGPAIERKISKASVASTSLEVRDRAKRILKEIRTRTVKPLEELLKLQGTVMSVTFSSDGKFLAASSDRGQVVVWDLADTSKPKLTLTQGSGITSISFSKDGQHLLAGRHSGAIDVWQLTHIKPKIVKAGKEIDLIAVEKEFTIAAAGKWRRNGKVVQSNPPGYSMLTLPVRIAGDYELRIKFARVKGGDSANIILPIGDRQCMLVLGGWPAGGQSGQHTGLKSISGIGDDQDNTRCVTPLITGREYAVTVRVKHTNDDVAIQIDLDGKGIIKWFGKASRLSIDRSYQLTYPKMLGVGAWNTNIEYREAKLRMLTGQATILREIEN